ncbi:helix-turn-helix transcriptional regulator [Cellulomonas sp.]|uniref:helix-turn-helix domain-containing protein n=1 Tax=Cellulomonas sp. TaxID=40001 RepID=UPI001B2D6974|nr:helix-turn-helix transcriptional regulator [Cellulomonas sp.]MBO9555563.1 helix-turn-helix transcriptional regulator [Cellulomonas sp.]
MTCETCGRVVAGATPARAAANLRAHERVHAPDHVSNCGSRPGFVSHHARGEEPCDPCKKAAHEYHRAYYHEARKHVEGVPHVDARRVVRHVRELQRRGMGAKRIAARAGVSVSTVQTVEQRRHGIRPETARRLLAVTFDPGWRPAEPVARRVRALAAIGWPARDVASRAGVSIAVVADLTAGRSTRVESRSDDSLRAVYEALSMTPGPSEQVRKVAARKGWVPPLAWDDIDTDPAPAAASDERVTVVEEAEFLASAGVGFTEAATRLGTTPSALDKLLRYHHQTDLLHRMRGNERGAAA